MPTIGGEINIVNLTKYNWTLLSKSDGGGYQIDVGGILNKKVIQSGERVSWHIEWSQSGTKEDAQFNIWWQFDRSDREEQIHIQLADANAKHVNVQPLGFKVPGIDLGQSKDIGFTHDGSRQLIIWDATGNGDYRLINW